MKIERLDTEKFRKIRPELDRAHIDYIAECDNIENTVNLVLKEKSKILLSADEHKTEILFSYEGYYLHLKRNEYNKITIY